MKKRIYSSFLGLILLCVLLLSALICLIFYSASKNQEIASIKDRARLVSDLLNSSGHDQYIDYISKDESSARMTIITPDGTVLLDSKTDASTLGNHGGREEFIKAVQAGNGEATRYSSTLGRETYYYAVRLSDGNVLRISKPMNSVIEIFTTILPPVVIVTGIILLLAGFVVRRLTNGIVSPINAIDFESDNLSVYDELLPYVKKIDSQKNEIARQIAALKDRADTIEAITGNMREGLILIDKSGTTLMANKSAAEIFNESEMAGKNILHICRETGFQQEIKQCLSGHRSEMPFERGNHVYNVYFSPVHSDSETNGAVILFFDVTERHNAEKQRREFSANVSHELKTPLTTISALSEMIENGMAKDDDVKGFASRISEQSKRLLNIIEDIIRLSEFDEGSIHKDQSAFDIYELAGSIIAGLKNEADEKHVAVQLIGEHLEVTANKRMIDELLYNLIDNGIKYNKDGGQLTISLSGDGDYCKIAVSDTGIGIPKEHQERVFERFYRVDKSRSKRTGGTGLGLSIVKHIVEHHDGRIELKSADGVGTTVKCYIVTKPV